MKCLRCDGTGIDPHSNAWVCWGNDKTDLRCLNCEGSCRVPFKMWFSQLWDIVVWKLFRV